MEKLPTPSQPEPENKSLGCLFMKLEGILVAPVAGNSGRPPELTQNQQLKLYLTIQFKEQRELLVGGYIKFGLKGGRLRLKLKNVEIPLTSKQLGRSFELAIQKKKQPSFSSANQSNIEDSLPDQPGVKSNETTKKTEQSQFISCKVAVKGSPNLPVWIFQVDKDGSILKGVLKNTALATLDITTKPCYIEATFEVSPRDVYLTEAQGLWPKDISKKKSAVIERAIVRRFLEEKLKPYLSRQALRYD